MLLSRPFKAWVAGSNPAALTSNPLGLLNLQSQNFLNQEILTRSLRTKYLKVVHLASDRPCLVNGYHPSSHAGTQSMQSEPLPVRDLQVC